MQALRFAWRNLWRNGRRTAVTLAAVTFSTGILIASDALMWGLVEHTVSNATNLIVGEVQAHAEGYLRDRSIYNAIDDPDALLEAARQKGVGAAPRSYGYGLIAHGTKSAGASLWGVNPAAERAAFDLPGHTIPGKGAFLADTPAKGVVIGRKLAKTLEVEVGDEVVVVVQAADGSLGNDLFHVAGILKIVGEDVDRGGAIIHQKDFSDLFVSDGRIHEVTFNSRGVFTPEQIEIFLEGTSPKAELKTWREILPLLSDMLTQMDSMIWIFAAIFFVAAGLGVMNTMLMATHERIKEFGVLKALGTAPWQILRDVAAEAFVLGFTGSVLGSLLGLAGSWYLSVHGIDTSQWAPDVTMGGVAFDPLWRAVIRMSTVYISSILMWVVCILASLYPAAIAARLDPVKAIQHV